MLSKQEKGGNRINTNRINDTKVFTKRWQVKLRRNLERRRIK